MTIVLIALLRIFVFVLKRTLYNPYPNSAEFSVMQ